MFYQFSKFILLISLSVALQAHACFLPSAREVPAQMRALEVYENPKISTNLSLRFAELGRLSGLLSVYEPRRVGCPVPFQMAATNDSLSKALSKTDAIKETPSYKIRAKFGFTEVIEGSINSDLGYIVRKPKPNHP